MNMITTIVRSGEAARTVVGENTAYALVARTGAEAARDATVTARDVVLAAIDVDYASLAAATAGAANGAFFTYRDASGNPIYATKTGGVVTELPGPWFSSAKVGFQYPATGSVMRDLAMLGIERVSVLNWIPVSKHAYIQGYQTRSYTTTNPSTDALQTYIQAAIDWCRTNRKKLIFPDGLYRITDSLQVYGDEDTGETVIEGAGEYSAIIFGADPTKDVVVNHSSTGTDFRRFTLRNICLRGGRRGISFTRTGSQVTSLMHLQNVRLEEHAEIGFRNDQYLISSLFDNVVFYYCNSAFYNGRNCNNVTFNKCRAEGIDGDIFEFASPGSDVNGCEDVLFIAPRIEARNTQDGSITGKSVFKGYRLSNFTVEGGYLESTHRIIISETGGLGLIKFHGTHFTGQEPDVAPVGFKGEQFAAYMVTLDNCRFNTGTNGNARMLLTGNNIGISRTTYGHYTAVGAHFAFTGKEVTVPHNTATTLQAVSRTAPADAGEPVGGENLRISAGKFIVIGEVKTATARAMYAIHADAFVRANSAENLAVTFGNVLVTKDDPDSILSFNATPLKGAGASATALNLQAEAIAITGTVERSIASAEFFGIARRGAAKTYLEFA